VNRLIAGFWLFAFMPDSLWFILRKHTPQNALKVLEKLNTLSVQNSNNLDLRGVYARGLLEMMKKAPSEIGSYVKRIFALMEESCELAYYYAEALSYIIESKTTSATRSELNELRFLCEKFPENESIAKIYSEVIESVFLNEKNLSFEMLSFYIDELSTLSTQFPPEIYSYDFQFSYAYALVQLVKLLASSEKKNEAKIALEKLHRLNNEVSCIHDGDATDVTEMYVFALSYFNEVQSPEERQQTVEIVRMLHESNSENRNISHEYSKMLSAIKLQSLDASLANLLNLQIIANNSTSYKERVAFFDGFSDVYDRFTWNDLMLHKKEFKKEFDLNPQDCELNSKYAMLLMLLSRHSESSIDSIMENVKNATELYSEGVNNTLFYSVYAELLYYSAYTASKESQSTKALDYIEQLRKLVEQSESHNSAIHSYTTAFEWYIKEQNINEIKSSLKKIENLIFKFPDTPDLRKAFANGFSHFYSLCSADDKHLAIESLKNLSKSFPEEKWISKKYSDVLVKQFEDELSKSFPEEKWIFEEDGDISAKRSGYETFNNSVSLLENEKGVLLIQKLKELHLKDEFNLYLTEAYVAKLSEIVSNTSEDLPNIALLALTELRLLTKSRNANDGIVEKYVNSFWTYTVICKRKIPIESIHANPSEDMDIIWKLIMDYRFDNMNEWYSADYYAETIKIITEALTENELNINAERLWIISNKCPLHYKISEVCADLFLMQLENPEIEPALVSTIAYRAELLIQRAIDFINKHGNDKSDVDLLLRDWYNPVSIVKLYVSAIAYLNNESSFTQSEIKAETLDDLIKKLSSKESIGLHVYYAMMCNENGEFNKAIHEIDYSIGLFDEADVEEITFLLLVKAELLYMNAEYKSTIDVCSIVINIDSKSIQAYSYRAMAFQSSEDYTNAIIDYRNVFDLYNSHITDDIDEADDINISVLYGNRGMCYRKINNYEKAIDDLTNAIYDTPNEALYYFERGASHYYNENTGYAYAIKDFNVAIEIRNDYDEAFYYRAFAHSKINKYVEALFDIDTAIELGIDTSSAHNRRAFILLNLENYEEAFFSANRAIELGDNSSYVYDNRGCAYAGLGDYDLAIEDFTIAILKEPPSIEAYKDRADVYKKLNMHDKASEDMEKYKELVST